MALFIQRLSEKHLPLVDAFCCTETKEDLKEIKAAERRRIINHSKEMEDFLKKEAIDEQEKSLNTTYLLFEGTEENPTEIVGYISLCNDSIRLDPDEKKMHKYTYTTVPALKIARLAVSNNYKGKGIGRNLINFSVFLATKIRIFSGVAFITLDCYEHRVSYYEGRGFKRNIIQPIVLPYDSPISMRLVLDEYLENIENQK